MSNIKSTWIEEIIHSFNEDENSIEILEEYTNKWRSPRSIKEILGSMIRTLEDSKELIRIKKEDSISFNIGDKVIHIPTGVHATIEHVYSPITNYFRYKLIDEHGFSEYAKEDDIELDTEDIKEK